MSMPVEYINQIVTGDARVLADQVPDESVDLIFTDPIYSDKSLYDWLAAIALRVLKPTGALLCWSNGKWHRQNANWLEAGGLTYRWDFCQMCRNGPAPMNGNIIAKVNRLIWLDTNARSAMLGYLPDGYQTIPWSLPGTEWGWTKDPRFTERAIEAFSDSTMTVFDPFTGGGTVPAVCKMLGRQYIAFEIDPATAQKARERVAHTQAMHPLFLEEQHSMELAI